MENVSINVNAPAESISVEPTRRYLNTRSTKVLTRGFLVSLVNIEHYFIYHNTKMSRWSVHRYNSKEGTARWYPGIQRKEVLPVFGTSCDFDRRLLSHFLLSIKHVCLGCNRSLVDILGDP